MKFLYCFVILTMLAFSGAGYAAEKIYRWVDDEGVTHFTAHPPKNRESEVVRVQTGRSDPVKNEEKASEEQPAKADQSEAAIQQSRDDAYRCSVAQENLKVLQTSARVQVQEGDEIRYLNEEEQRERAEQAQQIIAESCQPGR